MHIIPQKEGETLHKYIQRFSRVQYNIPDVHPAAVISACHQNMRNRKMRKELAMTKVKDMAELYVLADRCARAEEGRKYPGKDAGTETDSTDEDAATPTKKGRLRNRKCKGKAVLAVEGSDDTGAGKKVKADTPRQGDCRVRRLPGLGGYRQARKLRQAILQDPPHQGPRHPELPTSRAAC